MPPKRKAPKRAAPPKAKSEKKSKKNFRWEISDFKNLKARVNGAPLQTVNVFLNKGTTVEASNKWVKNTLRDLFKKKEGWKFQVQYAVNGMWAHTKWLDNSSEFLTPDLNNYDIDIGNATKMSMIKINAKRAPKKFGGHSDPYNNCLYYAIKYALTPEVAKQLKTFPDEAWKMKKMLKIAKDAPIHVDSISLLESKLKMNINVIGDHEYTSPNKFARTVLVQLEDGHYEYKANKNILTALRMNIKPRDLVFYQLDETIVTTYDGSQVERHDDFDRDEFTTSDTKTYQEVKLSEDIVQTYKDFIVDAEHLETLTGINLRNYGYKYKNAALNIFYQHAKVFDFDELDEIEMRWLAETKTCGLMFAQEATGPMNVYDVNSFYTYLMTHNKNCFPTRKPTFEHVEELGHLCYGIYRARITGANPRLFQVNQNHHYTHVEMARAQELGATVELIQDGQANLMRYTNHRVNGDALFMPYFDKLVKHKNDINEITGKKNPLVKKIINVLWGALCERTKMYLRDADGLEFKDDDEFNIRMDYDGADFFQVIRNYKRPHARIGAFLTAFGRAHISRLMEPLGDTMLRCHTDGFYTTATFETSAELGGLKLEKCGDFEIRSLNNIKVLS